MSEVISVHGGECHFVVQECACVCYMKPALILKDRVTLPLFWEKNMGLTP